MRGIWWGGNCLNLSTTSPHQLINSLYLYPFLWNHGHGNCLLGYRCSISWQDFFFFLSLSISLFFFNLYLPIYMALLFYLPLSFTFFPALALCKHMACPCLLLSRFLSVLFCFSKIAVTNHVVLLSHRNVCSFWYQGEEALSPGKTRFGPNGLFGWGCRSGFMVH